MISFDVFGTPQPQGSHRAVPVGRGRVKVTDNNLSLPGWRDTVMWAARKAIADEGANWGGPLVGPLWLEAVFYLPRPMSAPKTVDVYPTKKPDGSKLLRAIEDSMVDAGLILDDALFVDCAIYKRYAVGPHLAKIYDAAKHRSVPGAHITVDVVPPWLTTEQVTSTLERTHHGYSQEART